MAAWHPSLPLRLRHPGLALSLPGLPQRPRTQRPLSLLPTLMPHVREESANLRRQEIILRAYEMRKEGLSYRAIADKLGVPLKTLHRWLTGFLEKERDRTSETAQQLIQLQHQRLEAMLAAIWPRLMRGDNARMIEVGLKIMERQSNLHGLDAPKKVEAKLEVLHLSDDELRQEAEKLRIDLGKLEIVPLLPGESQAPEEVLPRRLTGPEVTDAEVVPPEEA